MACFFRVCSNGDVQLNVPLTYPPHRLAWVLKQIYLAQPTFQRKLRVVVSGDRIVSMQEPRSLDCFLF